MMKIPVALCAFASFLLAVVNINTAGIDELKTLKGIGEGKAQAIVDYRKERKFSSIDELKNVKGIGDKLYNKIKDDVVVK